MNMSAGYVTVTLMKRRIVTAVLAGRETSTIYSLLNVGYAVKV